MILWVIDLPNLFQFQKGGFLEMRKYWLGASCLFLFGKMVRIALKQESLWVMV